MRKQTVWCVLALLLCAAWPLAGCGQKEEPPAESPQTGHTPVQPPEAKGPAVNTVLALAPEGTALKAAAPSFAHFHDMMLACAERFAPGQVDASMRDAAGKLAEYTELEKADDLVAVLEQGGIDANAPWGVFLDLAPESDQALKDLGRLVAGLGSSEGAGGAAGQMPAAAKMGMAKLTNAMRFLAMFTVSDAETAEAFIRRAYAKQAPADAEWEERTAAGQTYYCLNTGKLDVCYALAGGRLLVGNPTAFIEMVLSQVDAPAEPLYGTDAFPVIDEGEAVCFVRLDLMAELMAAYAEGIKEVNPLMASAIEKQLYTPEGELVYSSADPMMAALFMPEARVKMTARMRTSEHPHAIESAGVPQPLVEAGSLPANTEAALAFVLSAKAKDALTESLSANVPAQTADDPQVAQALAMTQTVLSVLGEEIVLAFHELGGEAAASLRVQIANRDMLDFLLLMAAGAAEPTETYKGVGIVQPPEGSPQAEMGFAYAYLGDTLVLSHSLDVVKAHIDAQETGSNWLDSLQPAAQSDRPVWSFLSIEGAYLRDAVLPTIEKNTPMPIPPDKREPFVRIINAIDYVRMYSGIEGPYAQGEIELALTPAEEETTPAASP